MAVQINLSLNCCYKGGESLEEIGYLLKRLFNLWEETHDWSHDINEPDTRSHIAS